MLEGNIHEPGRNDVSAAGRNGALSALLVLAEDLLQAQDLRQALTATVRMLGREMAADQVLILGYAQPPSQLRILAAFAAPAREVSISGPLSLPASDGNDAPAFPESWQPGVHAASWLSRPLTAGAAPFGLMCVLSERSGGFSGGDEAFLHGAADLLNAALRRLQVEAQRRSRLQQLYQADLEQTLHILGNCVRHELAQPMTAALGYLFCCLPGFQEAEPDTAKIANLQGKAIAEIQRLNEKVGRLRETLENRSVDPVATDINGLIDAALDLLREEIERLDVSIQFTPEPGLPAVRLDHSMGLQLFHNLLQACLGAVERAVRRNITVTSGRVWSGDVEVGIAHSGPPFHRDFLNNPYISGSLGNLQAGTFALAACRYIIDTHHGGFRLAAMPGGGSGLYISLPAHERGETVNRQRQYRLHSG